MVETWVFEVAAIGVVAACLIAAAVRRHGFVFFAVLAMFGVMAISIIPGAVPNGRAFPDLTWHYAYIDQPLQWYRLATHIFVHDAATPAHIVGNVFTFVLLGWPLEEKIGWRLTMAIFFVTGIVGALVSSPFVLATRDPAFIHAQGYGASGAIFGVIGYFAVRYPKEQVYAPLFVILARVPVAIAAIVALIVQAVVLLQINNPLIGSLPWPSVLAHVTCFGIGMIATRVPGLRSQDTPSERAFHLDLAPLRELAVKPADKMEVEGIIAEDIAQVAQVKLEAFVKRARCPKCQGVLELKGKKLTSDCGWSLEFSRRPSKPQAK